MAGVAAAYEQHSSRPRRRRERKIAMAKSWSDGPPRKIRQLDALISQRGESPMRPLAAFTACTFIVVWLVRPPGAAAQTGAREQAATQSPAQNPFPDRLVLSNGTTVECRVVSETQASVVARIRVGGIEAEVTYQRSSIRAIHRNVEPLVAEPSEPRKEADRPATQPVTKGPGEPGMRGFVLTTREPGRGGAEVTDLMFTGDGNTLVGAAPAVWVWDLHTRKQLPDLSFATGESTRLNAFARRGGAFIVVVDGKKAVLCDGVTGKPGRGAMSSAPANAWGDLSPDGSLVARIAFEQNRKPVGKDHPPPDEVQLWSTSTGAMTRSLVVNSKRPGVRLACVLFSPDSSRLAAVSIDGRITVWNTDGKELAVLDGDAVPGALLRAIVIAVMYDFVCKCLAHLFL